jgi:hypothetical protein
MWTLAFGHHKDRTPTHTVCGDARGCNDGVRQVVAARWLVIFGWRVRKPPPTRNQHLGVEGVAPRGKSLLAMRMKP